MNTIADALNEHCFCVPVDRGRLDVFLAEQSAYPGFADLLEDGHKHLFSTAAMFVSRSDLNAMMATVATLEEVARNPLYQALALSGAPEIARTDFGPLGVLMGYDFHLTDAGPKLIEINTNAGGVCLNDAARKVRNNCCGGRSGIHAYDNAHESNFENQFVSMFRDEYRRQRGLSHLQTVAIVDADPEHQYLYPEFILTKAMLERAGIKAFICSPEDLHFDGHELTVEGAKIDLVYNRHTDFYLTGVEMARLRQAYASGAVVLTPNPHHHALYANKANLVSLSDPEFIAKLALGDEQKKALSAVPATYRVTAEKRDWFWDKRKSFFFKPVSGHAGKAVYRGDKVTKSVFEHICQGGYIAQELVVPSIRKIEIAGIIEDRKADIRLYTYAGTLILPAARLYQGQTTNFRTPGGGFAPILITD